MESRRATAKSNKEPTHTVSFRVDARTQERLDSEAQKLSMSPGAFARKLVIDTLEDHRHAQLLDEATQTREDVALLRRDLAATLEMILLNFTEASKDEVYNWITDNLSTPGGR